MIEKHRHKTKIPGIVIVTNEKEDKMPYARSGDTVKVHYTGRLEDGRVFGTSVDQTPLQFKIGEGQVIPGFEKAIVGMSPGETKTVEVPKEEAYGVRRQSMVYELRRDEFPPNVDPEVGQQLQVREENGGTRIVTVTDVSDDSVTIDANHPLVGRDLVFDIELLEIV